MTASAGALCAVHNHVRTFDLQNANTSTLYTHWLTVSFCPMQAPEQPAGYENAWSALDSRNAAPKPLRRTTRTLPQVLAGSLPLQLLRDDTAADCAESMPAGLDSVKAHAAVWQGAAVDDTLIDVKL